MQVIRSTFTANSILGIERALTHSLGNLNTCLQGAGFNEPHEDSPLRTEGISEIVMVQSRNPVGEYLTRLDDIGGHLSQLLSGHGKLGPCQSRISVAKQNG